MMRSYIERIGKFEFSVLGESYDVILELDLDEVDNTGVPKDP